VVETADRSVQLTLLGKTGAEFCDLIPSPDLQ
jgi:hypothetical protein